jgi:hypothetical protein
MVYPKVELRPQKLDGRYTGNHLFQYRIDFDYRSREQFKQIRNWCWETFGPSCELNFLTKDEEKVWAWTTDSYRVRLYLKSDKEVNWYKLRWL